MQNQPTIESNPNPSGVWLKIEGHCDECETHSKDSGTCKNRKDYKHWIVCNQSCLGRKNNHKSNWRVFCFIIYAFTSFWLSLSKSLFLSFCFTWWLPTDSCKVIGMRQLKAAGVTLDGMTSSTLAVVASYGFPAIYSASINSYFL